MGFGSSCLCPEAQPLYSTRSKAILVKCPYCLFTIIFSIILPSRDWFPKLSPLILAPYPRYFNLSFPSGILTIILHAFLRRSVLVTTCHVQPSSSIGSMKLNVVRSEDVELHTFSGALAKLRKANISFVMFVQLSVRTEQIGSKWKDFHEILHLSIFRKCRENLKNL
jgi:hypothetical protein